MAVAAGRSPEQLEADGLAAQYSKTADKVLAAKQVLANAEKARLTEPQRVVYHSGVVAAAKASIFTLKVKRDQLKVEHARALVALEAALMEAASVTADREHKDMREAENSLRNAWRVREAAPSVGLTAVLKAQRSFQKESDEATLAQCNQRATAGNYREALDALTDDELQWKQFSSNYWFITVPMMLLLHACFLLVAVQHPKEVICTILIFIGIGMMWWSLFHPDSGCDEHETSARLFIKFLFFSLTKPNADRPLFSGSFTHFTQLTQCMQGQNIAGGELTVIQQLFETLAFAAGCSIRHSDAIFTSLEFPAGLILVLLMTRQFISQNILHRTFRIDVESADILLLGERVPADDHHQWTLADWLRRGAAVTLCATLFTLSATCCVFGCMWIFHSFAAALLSRAGSAGMSPVLGGAVEDMYVPSI